MVTKMVYTSIAMPPYGVAITQKYDLNKDAKGYFFTVGKEKIYEDIEIIKSLFEPVGKTWDEVLKRKKTVTEEK